MIKKAGNSEMIEAFHPRIQLIVQIHLELAGGFTTSYPMFTTHSTHQKIENCRKQMSKSVELGCREHEMVD